MMKINSKIDFSFTSAILISINNSLNVEASYPTGLAQSIVANVAKHLASLVQAGAQFKTPWVTSLCW